ncbi:putative esterase [Ancylobacter novellus DSM 506]|uniref:Esterase n=1 Tax=Ancylobacter novellus (strain ATCC 8093 / DSM 506 / JCM 20403 / CCM 1077 / IAM 12100 / NBRC 12443 / NCIMB 10456) TaxID=639283 RepID=D7AAP2_ANCN5|nr:alpha/beta hydrolase-fold protein [Ancylobacter novellus]ADH90909.1 putative esterase [Ancylobacter novellus DSM 506]
MTDALIPDTTVFDFFPGDGSATWRIFLYRPPGEPPAEGWPVLYYTDANAVAGTAADIMRVQAAWPLGTGIEWGVMVGIGYPTDGAYDSVRRSWDLGPPPGQTYPPHTPDGPDVRTGGADDFLAFIEEALKPEIARRVAIDPARQAITGHSFGGLFVLHTLFRRPAAFSRWISASPAIWWEGAGIVGAAETFVAEGKPRDGHILLLAGEYEQKLAPFQIGAPDEEKRRAAFEESRIVDNTRLMAERLAQVPGLVSEYVFLPGETHMSVLPACLNHAIRFAFGRDRT